MKITYREASRDDVIRQYRYYLVTLELPEVAIRFMEAVKKTANAIREMPRAAPPYRLRNRQLQNLRSWPLAGFEALRLYFLADDEAIRVVRILHGKRNIRRIRTRADNLTLIQFGSRLVEVHMSEVNTASRHDPLSRYAVMAFCKVAKWIPENIPIIPESPIDQGRSDVASELQRAREVFSPAAA